MVHWTFPGSKHSFQHTSHGQTVLTHTTYKCNNINVAWCAQAGCLILNKETCSGTCLDGDGVPSNAPLVGPLSWYYASPTLDHQCSESEIYCKSVRTCIRLAKDRKSVAPPHRACPCASVHFYNLPCCVFELMCTTWMTSACKRIQEIHGEQQHIFECFWMLMLAYNRQARSYMALSPVAR